MQTDIILGILIITNGLAWILLLRHDRKLKTIDTQAITNQLDKIEENLSIKQLALKEEIKSEVSSTKDRIDQLEVSSKHSIDLFRTVVHGFDFIVQGCKKAIDVMPSNNFNDITESLKKVESSETKKELANIGTEQGESY